MVASLGDYFSAKANFALPVFRAAQIEKAPDSTVG